MSGFDRKVKRAQEKKAYVQFCKSWQAQRAYQKWLKGDGDKEELEKSGPELGRKPTFLMWKKMCEEVAKRKAAEQASKREQVQAEIPDLEWKED